MLEVVFILMAVLAAFFGVGFVVLFFYRKTKYHKKQVERSLKMVPFMVTIPKESGQEKATGPRDQREVGRELIANAENMYNTLFGIYKGGWRNIFKNFIFRPRHIALEIVSHKKEVCFYIAVPYALTSLVEKAVTTHFPDAQIEEVEEHNIFSPQREMVGVRGGYVFGYKTHTYPIKTYMSIDNEPLEAVTNALSMLEEDEGAAIQILIRPANPKVMTASKSLVHKIQNGPGEKSSIGKDLATHLINPNASNEQKNPQPYRTTPMEEQAMKELDRKGSKFGFETQIRVIVAARDENRADLVWGQIKSAFGQFSDLSINGLKFRGEANRRKLVTDFIFRFFNDSMLNLERFWPSERGYRLILNTEELASLYHFPNALIQTPGIKWLPAKSQAIPVNLPKEGGAGTGTFALEAASGVYDELQPGSYLFMDRDYADNEPDPAAPRFEHALFVKAQVMSVGARHAVVDAGHKSHAVDSGLPRVHDPSGRCSLAFENAGDEHGLVRPLDGGPLPALGDTVWLVPGHCDPTVNLHDRYVGVRGGLVHGRVERYIRIDARGALT